MKNIKSIPITFEVNNEIDHSDGRFLQVAVTMMHLGKNLNGSIFTKDVVEENLNTIRNIPILGFIETLSDGSRDFKGHEYILTKTEKGLERVYKGACYGVIPESCSPRWIYKVDQFGEEHEYLQVDGLLWSKLEGADILLNDDSKAVSMELFPTNIDGYENENGDFVFEKFSFDGVCILGEGVQEAMSGADIVIKDVQFSVDSFTKSIKEELCNIYSTFTKLVDEKTNGGVENMENTDFSQTMLNMFSDVAALISQHEVTTDKYGWECPRYYAVDIQENEVIVVDTKNNYNYYGIDYTVDGDKPVVDFESAKRKKLRYENYEEGASSPEGAFDFNKHISEIKDNAFAKVEEANMKVSEAENKVVEFEAKASEFETAKNEIEEKFNQVNAEFEEMKPKYEDFVKAEQARIEAELDAQKDAEFAKYEVVLADDVNFTALKEKKSEMTVKEIESECAIMYARKNLATNFSKSDSGIMTAGLIDNNNFDDGYIDTKYGRIRKS